LRPVRFQHRGDQLARVGLVIHDSRPNAFQRLRLGAGYRRAHRFVGINGADRQFYGECRAFAFALAFGVDAATVHLDQLSHERQSQTEPALSPSAGHVRLEITFEQVRHEFRTDAAARVRHADLNVGIHSPQTYFDAPAFLREFDSVREQIPDHLLQAVRVACDLVGCTVERRFERDALGVGRGAHDIHRFFDQRRQVDRLDFELQFASYNTRGVHEVFDQL
jgi:hypothetical protein